MSLVDLTKRALPHELPELMDQPCSFDELLGCLRDIARVNSLTFAHRPTLSWLSALPRQREPLHIVDVGCGYGDSLRKIHRWAAGRGTVVSLTGIDLNGDAIRAATDATPSGMGIRWIHADAFSYQPSEGIDIVLSSLLTHHLEETEIVRFLIWMEAAARLGWFVNDLHRTSFPYRAFGWLTRLIPFHPFVRHDGAVSIRRSFRIDDWERMCVAAGLSPAHVSIREHRPARLCVGRTKA